MSKLRAWICLVVVMALMLTMGLLTTAGSVGLVQADDDPVVIFPDRNLEAAIRAAINKPVDDIHQSDLEELTEFSDETIHIINLTGLEHCTNLTSLYLRHNPISDISPLASLTNLTSLDLWDNQISDISPLANLTSLTLLNLRGNQISDISQLGNLTNLTLLHLDSNNISDISPLANLTSLTELDLGSNNISHIKPLVDNPGLGDGDYVALRFNPLSDASLNTYIPQLEARGVIVDYRDVSGWCFIATAAYGTPIAEEIQILREFRDEYLLTNPVGQALVDLYYRVSPPMAEFITEHPKLKPIVRAGLLPAVVMSTVAVNTTPAEKTAILGLLALVSVALVVSATRRRGRGPEYTRG
jgi:Leucine-rich repeat (LRR) protein